MKPIWPSLFFLAPLGLAIYLAVKHLPWGVGLGFRPATGNDNMDRVEFWGALVIGILVTGALCAGSAAIGWELSNFIGDRSDKVWVKRGAWTMVSIRSADAAEGEISGNVFMLSGFYDSRQIYYYYTLNNNGSFSPGRWYPDRYTYIFEEDRQDGQIVEYAVEFKRPWVAWFAAPDDDIKKEFHIPRGSLKKTFALE